jgi:ATP-dependent DNA helicase RecG
MPVPERRAIMDAFRRGEMQVLVATTVIEVGVDVPNATLMVIEGADLFGLAQLHQLRGRVGRGSHESFCILLADPATDEARRRLDAMASTSDGFELAEVDLDLRGEGTVLAVKQSGIPDLRHARLTRHRKLAAEAREEAADQLAADPDLETATGAIIAAATRRTFGDDVDWLAQA